MNPDQVVTKATGISWEAGMVAFILLTALGFLVWLIRAWMQESTKREERMNIRINTLETFQQTILKDALERNTLALNDFRTALSTKPCLWLKEHQETSRPPTA